MKELPQSHIPINQRIIVFLARCREHTDNPYKQRAYTRAINQVYSSWSTIDREYVIPKSIGPSIRRKITELLEGFPEDDILYS